MRSCATSTGAANWSPCAGDEAKPCLTPNQVGNPNLGPERTRELELGFEASAVNGRLNADFTYYNARTVEALIQVTYPPSQGWLDSQLENLGELHNSGIELLLVQSVEHLGKQGDVVRVRPGRPGGTGFL
jgi:TonB-dependent starch-binding outer membrane protein SusC